MVAAIDRCHLIWVGVGADEPPADCGAKAGGLVTIAAAGLRTEAWFVVRSAAIRDLLDRGASSEAARAVADACRMIGLCDGGSLAVRSSARDEDGSTASFAGQYRTVLDVVGTDAVLAAIVRCATGLRDQDRYRLALGLPALTEPIAVIVQKMVMAQSSGVAFSRGPDGDPGVVIAATRGLGDRLVAGLVDGDEYRVSIDGAVSVTRIDPTPADLVSKAPVSGRCMSNEQAREVAEAARRLERHCGCPQDVEWAFDADGELVVLQTRPITTLQTDPCDENLRVWDNANIVESYPGLTTPLTFSVAREAYASVYRQACLALGVRPNIVAAKEPVFEQMIGLIDGRVYYNLNSWHRVLALLPGFRHNQAFMERMMGARRPDGPTDTAVASRPRPPFRESVWMGLTLARRWMTLERECRRFLVAVEALRSDFRAGPVGACGADALLDQYEELRMRALGSWRAPIMNDLALMVAHGALRRAAERWLGDDANAVVNDLLRTGNVASLDPARSVAEIAAKIRAHPAMCDAFLGCVEASLAEDVRHLPALDPIRQWLESYLERWGARCPGELQLDRTTYAEDATPLLRAVRDAVEREPGWLDDGVRSADRGLRIDRRLSSSNPVVSALRRWAFGVLLSRTRWHLARREAMRFARGEVFAIVRRIFNALGEDLAARRVLAAGADVHYLDVREVRALVHGTGFVGDPRALVSARRAAYEAYRAAPSAPGRFETRGPVVLGGRRSMHSTVAATGCGAVLRGTGAAPGMARGPAILVEEPNQAPSIDGRIVVARSTDPGWIPLLMSAAGLLVERGSVLSHSAIVARELGIPTIVGIPGLMESIAPGQVVSMNGSSGEVILEDASVR